MMVKWSLVGARALDRVNKVRASALLYGLVLFSMLFLAGCAGGSPVAGVAVVTETATAQPPTSTPLPPPTATLMPTVTPEIATPTLIPTVTPEPSFTPLPALAVLPDGFQAWCAPVEYEGASPDGPDAPDYARPMTQSNGQYRVPIPGAYCTVAFQFNQPAPEGATLRVLDGGSPFIQQPLQPAQGQVNSAWTTLTHSYVINPPFWEVTYTLSVQGPGGDELWSSPVTFAKALPKDCPYGGLPDPVTMYCAVTDPWEVEPHPDAVYPYDRSPFLTPSADD